MMKKFLQVLMRQADALELEDHQTATGTYADGLFPLTREEAPETRADRMRHSYQRDTSAASHLADNSPIFS
ncbi:hypothetical protein [Rhizobium sp. FKY42]|uniref:hypothetical protein n=1 Tax=Rhizobium sp. FKY42 TaxID=2562310 RepID=UPI0010BF7F74|nr:hypothetical protein [Rhizobium sp. FKY42]